MSDDLFSVDKLVEFGMGVAIANQMTSAMNKSMSHMNDSEPAKSSLDIESMYYVVIGGKQEGPYSVSELSRLISEKIVVKETYIWKPGMDCWTTVENVEEVIRIVALTPPPIP